MTTEEKLELNLRKLYREHIHGKPCDILWEYGKDILTSPLFEEEKKFHQHGNFSVYDHSILVTLLAIRFVKKRHLKVDIESLIRASLLHDYFLYDWHIKPHPKHHANLHAEYAWMNAQRDFGLNTLEGNIIKSHMWPLHFYCFPSTKEAWIINVCDTFSALKETLGSPYLQRELNIIKERINTYKLGEDNKANKVLKVNPQF